jgi:hypothetical protein
MVLTNSKPRGVNPQKNAGPDNLKCNNCKVLKLRQLRICDEQFWDLRVPTDGGDTELPDAYRRSIQIPISICLDVNDNHILKGNLRN